MYIALTNSSICFGKKKLTPKKKEREAKYLFNPKLAIEKSPLNLSMQLFIMCWVFYNFVKLRNCLFDKAWPSFNVSCRLSMF